MNTIRTAKPDGIKAAKGGLIIFFETDGIGQYLRWYGFNDPSYNGAVNDASMYMFIDRKYAYAAQNKHRRKGQIK